MIVLDNDNIEAQLPVHYYFSDLNKATRGYCM